MQDQEHEPYNPYQFILRLPQPFWQVLKRPSPPAVLSDLQKDHKVAVAATKCGCILVRVKRYSKSTQQEDGTYKCSVCEQRMGRNRQERLLLGLVKDVVHGRPEEFLICVQMPLPDGTFADVVIVPRHAVAIQQLTCLELDGTTHLHKPWQDNMNFVDSFNVAVDRDNQKEHAARSVGMQFDRIRITEVHEQQWKDRLDKLLAHSVDCWSV